MMMISTSRVGWKMVAMNSSRNRVGMDSSTSTVRIISESTSPPA